MPDASFLDNPLLLSTIFYPRPALPQEGLRHAIDGRIPLDDGNMLGYRFYRFGTSWPTIVYFHGNGEIAPDHDGIAEGYRDIRANLLVIDYRGYGWSTGTPLVSRLLPDAELVLAALPLFIHEQSISGSLFLMGRSLGSCCAIHLAHASPGTFRGLIIESGFATIGFVLVKLGFPANLARELKDPFDNIEKMKHIALPSLIIHGEADSLIPYEQGVQLYEACASPNKQLATIRGAGHNDLLMVGMRDYFAAIAALLA